MANYMHTEQYQLNDALRSEYSRSGLKTEPFDYELTRNTYTYPAQQPYTEEELAESLGWVEYPHITQSNLLQRQGMQLGAEITSQHRCASIPISNSLASNNTYSSVPMLQSGHSPSGWQSSLDSPSLMPETTNHRESGMAQISEAEHDRKDGQSFAAEKKAMRRYSHNAVERRRRDNINEQIHELALLVNELNHVYSPRPDSEMNNVSTNTKPNKGVVLRRSVEYIRMLRNIVEEKSGRERILEEEIVRLGGDIPRRAAQDTSVSMWIDESAIAEDDD